MQCRSIGQKDCFANNYDKIMKNKMIGKIITREK